jgi:hypothetical protein
MTEPRKVEYLRWTTYGIDTDRCKAEFADELAETLAEGRTEEDFIRESFGELLDEARGYDHLTRGRIIWTIEEDAEENWL